MRDTAGDFWQVVGAKTHDAAGRCTLIVSHRIKVPLHQGDVP